MTHTTPRSKPATLRAAFALALILALAACGPESIIGADPDLGAMTGGAFEELATYADEDGTVTAPLTIECVGQLQGAPEGIGIFFATTPGDHTLDVTVAFPDVCKTPGEQRDVRAYLKIEDIEGESVAVGTVAFKFYDAASPYLVFGPAVMVESGTQLSGPEAGTRTTFGGPVTVNHILPNTKDPSKEQILPDTKDPFKEEVIIEFHSDTVRGSFSGRLSAESEPVTVSDVSALMEFDGIYYATPFGPVALGELRLEIPDYGSLASKGFMVGDLNP